MLRCAVPAPRSRRSAGAVAPSSSGTTCPPLCHSIVMFSQRDGTLKSCAALSSSSALPSTCNEGTVINWGTSRSMLVGRRSHGVLQKLMKNWSDSERAATAAAMSAPSEMPQMPLIGACCSIQRSTCRTLSQTAAARPDSSTAADSQPNEACEQLGRWAHGMRRVEELYLKAVSSELGQPAGELQYPAHQRAVPCLAVQHEQPPGGRVEQTAAGSRAQLCAVVACHLLGRQRPEFELSDDLFHRALCEHQSLHRDLLHTERLRQLVTELHRLHRGEAKRLVLGTRVHRGAAHLGEDPAGSFHSRAAAAAVRQRDAARHGRKRV
eukprot:scaffold13930_cov65-Phaeocystis_antarctica.AAC.10